MTSSMSFALNPVIFSYSNFFFIFHFESFRFNLFNNFNWCNIKSNTAISKKNILGPGELGFSCSRQLGYPWGGLLTLVLPRLKLYFFNGSSRDVIGVTYASRSYLMFFPNIHKEPQVTHHANFKSRERHDRADYMS